MDDGEDDPENHVAFPKHLQRATTLMCRLRLSSALLPICEEGGVETHHSQHGEEDDHGQAGVGGVRAGVDVGVSLLIQLQHAQPSNHVHEGGVCKHNRQGGSADGLSNTVNL